MSGDYVETALSDAGYEVTRQDFLFNSFRELSPATSTSSCPTSRRTSRAPTTSSRSTPAAATSRPTPAVDLVLPPGAEASTSTSGCETEDFADFEAGNIALDAAWHMRLLGQGAQRLRRRRGRRDHLQRGPGGTHRDAEPDGSATSSDDRSRWSAPRFEIGNELAALLEEGPVTVHLVTETLIELDVPTFNIIAETPTGRIDRVVDGRRSPRHRARRPWHQRQRVAARRRCSRSRCRCTQLNIEPPTACASGVGRRGGRPAPARRTTSPRSPSVEREGHRALPQLRHDRLAELRPLRLRRHGDASASRARSAAVASRPPSRP